MNVQGLTSDDAPSDDDENRLVMVGCPVCGGFHLVDPFNGPQPPADEKR
jgi:hypothetical protein